MITMTGMLIKGKTSLSSHVRMGSKREVDAFADETSFVSESRSMGEKWSKCNLRLLFGVWIHR